MGERLSGRGEGARGEREKKGEDLEISEGG